MSARVVVLAWTSLLVSSCASGVTEQIREHTYPSGFHYVTQGELRSAMERMADDARALDSLLVHSPPASNNELRAEVSALLADMRRAAAEIDPAGLPTNHPKLERHMSELIVQIEAAMRDASAEPPSYYLAWSMAAACVHCHGEERSSPPVAERR